MDENWKYTHDFLRLHFSCSLRSMLSIFRFYCSDLDVHCPCDTHTPASEGPVHVANIFVRCRPADECARWYFQLENRLEIFWLDLMETFIFMMPSMVELRTEKYASSWRLAEDFEKYEIQYYSRNHSDDEKCRDHFIFFPSEQNWVASRHDTQCLNWLNV